MIRKFYAYLTQLGQVRVGHLYPDSVLYLLRNVSVLEPGTEFTVLLMNSRFAQNINLVKPGLSTQ
jgi:hypothetical protein